IIKKKINTQKMKDKLVETKPQCEMPRRSLCKSNSENLKSDYVNVFILDKQSSQECDTNIKNQTHFKEKKYVKGKENLSFIEELMQVMQHRKKKQENIIKVINL